MVVLSTASRSPICSRDLRRARRSWFGPHTGRKSQNPQALSAGAGGSMPSSTARSIISNASMPMPRLRSLMGNIMFGETARRRAV